MIEMTMPDAYRALRPMMLKLKYDQRDVLTTSGDR